MLNIYVVFGRGINNTYYKAKSGKEALRRFKAGWKSDEVLSEIIDHPSFGIRLLTMELLVELAPDEFQIVDDVSQ